MTTINNQQDHSGGAAGDPTKLRKVQAPYILPETIFGDHIFAGDITCGDVTGKDGAWTRRLVRGGGGDSAVRSERSRLRLRRAFRLVSNSKAGVGSMVGGPSAGRESAALYAAVRPEPSKAPEASRAEIEKRKKTRALDLLILFCDKK